MSASKFIIVSKFFFSFLVGGIIAHSGLTPVALAETAFFVDVTSSHMPLDPKAHTLDSEFGDVDNDGDLDVILAIENAPNRLYVNDGRGKLTWRKGVFRQAKNDTEDLQISDFDGDGNLDVIFVAEHDQNHEFYLGNGDGTFREVTDRLPSRSEANDVEALDIDEDGAIDIVVGNAGEAGQNFVWQGSVPELGYFLDITRQVLPGKLDHTQDIKLADLNGDGVVDMVIGNEVPPNRLLLGGINGSFIEKSRQLDLPVQIETREVLLFDADGDGDKDILFCNVTSNIRKWVKDPQARILINDGKANFTDQTNTRLPRNKFSSWDCGTLDFDADGDLDLLLSAVAVPDFDPLQVRAYRNDGTGHFVDATLDVIPPETVGRSWDFEVGDLNGDGIQDVVIGGWRSQARLLLGKNP